jgi:hypothetical protein
MRVGGRKVVDDDVMVAWRHDGRDLEPDLGWPPKLVVPKLYELEERQVGCARSNSHSRIGAASWK